MKFLRLLLFLLIAGVSFGASQKCQTASAVPADQLKLASGKVILDNDGVAPLSGGQSVYVKLTNRSRTEIPVSYWIMIEILQEETKKYETNCLYQGVVAPNTNAVVWGSSSAEPPVPWRVSVTMGPESSDADEAVRQLGYEVYSNPPKPTKNSPKQ